MPLGNDLLIVALSANRHARLPYYVLMATAGSVLGCLLTDIVSRRGGEVGLERNMSRRRIEYIKKKIDKGAGLAIGLAALMPPPFPFTPFIAGAAAFQYPRKKLLGVIAGARLLRFSIEGLPRHPIRPKYPLTRQVARRPERGDRVDRPCDRRQRVFDLSDDRSQPAAACAGSRRRLNEWVSGRLLRPSWCYAGSPCKRRDNTGPCGGWTYSSGLSVTDDTRTSRTRQFRV